MLAPKYPKSSNEENKSEGWVEYTPAREFAPNGLERVEEEFSKENKKDLKSNELFHCEEDITKTEPGNAEIPASKFYKKSPELVGKGPYQKLISSHEEQVTAAPKTKRKKRKYKKLCLPPRRKRSKGALPHSREVPVEIHFSQKRHFSFDSGVDMTEERNFFETDILAAFDSYDNVGCLLSQQAAQKRSLFSFASPPQERYIC